MPARNSQDRALIARIASHRRWGAEPDRTAATAPARTGIRAKFEREADPDGILPPDEVAFRADHLMHAHMVRMSLKAAQGRRRTRERTARATAARAELDDHGGDQE